MLIPKSVAQNVIEAGLSAGADFCEIYAEESLAYKMLLQSSQVEYICGKDTGVGIRLIYGQDELNTYTNQLNEKHLISAIQNLTVTKRPINKKINLGEDPFQTPFITAFPHIHRDSNLEQKKIILQKINKELKSTSAYISQCILSESSVFKTVQIVNSEGVFVIDMRPRRSFVAQSIVEHQGQKEAGYQRIGLTGVSDFSEEELRQTTRDSGQMALNNLNAESMPAGVFPVIIHNGFGGVIFHEACGHGMETTAVAEKLSVFSDKLGKKVANPCVTAYDDGTLKDKYGFIQRDDEGTITQKTTLIEKGILKNYMTDKIGSKKTGYAITGSARRENYKYPPTSRMRNTFIAPGNCSLEEMIKDVDYGLFAENLGGGSVTPGTGAYNFTVGSGRLIKKGKLDKYVKGASLIGNGLDTLSKIIKVGTDLKLAPGHCGSISGWVPVTVGQPPILVSAITVGGTKT